MRHRYILGIDPSGNFNEGKGTTGWCLLDGKTKKILEIGSSSAKSYNSQMEYWEAHIALINLIVNIYTDVIISIEDYLLYANESASQINSKMETPQLLGVIKFHCYMSGIPLYIRKAAAVKKRWADHILKYEGYISKQKGHWYCSASKYALCDHERDAIRHAVHCNEFENK